jgi:heptosyltransferase-1
MRFDFAVDFQGLLKSAFVAVLSRADRVFGYHRSAAREPLACLAYSHVCRPRSIHVIDQHLELAAAAGARSVVRSFHIPDGEPEGSLPDTPFVLASPEAGWTAKEWPLEYWGELARLLHRDGCVLVVNARQPIAIDGPVSHVSGLPGLIWATRRAGAVVGLDSGPLHLAGALGKPGVAIFGPTDPARNGPPGNTIRVLRAPGAVTTYKRKTAVDSSMREVTPSEVWAALRTAMDS